MYNFRAIIICLFLCPLWAYSADSTAVASSKHSNYRNTVLLCMNYARQAPIGVLSKRFGGSNSVGFTFAYKFGRNFQVQGGVNTIFSGKVKESGILDSMIGNGGLLIDNTGTYADVRMYERGYNWHVDFGKIIPLGSFERNSGLLITGGLGFMQHKLKFTFQRTVLPQLENNYYKGYDRLTNGLMVRGFVGYQRIDPNGRMNFYAGMELLNGFTKNRRSYNYDTRKSDTELRNDMLLGLKIGIMISLSGRQAGNKKGDEERFFE